MNQQAAEVTWDKDDFLLSFPESIEVFEKGRDDGAEEIKERHIGGIASTETLDRQGEVVIQKGLDFTEFVNYGFFNDNHRQDTAAVVGVPEMAKFMKSRGWWVEGYLLKGNDKADEIWQLAKSLQPTGRRLGFSIEGKIKKRESHKILRAIVRHVAITNSPVNTDCTWDLLAKSFCCSLGSGKCKGGCCEAGKSLAVGYTRGEGGRVLVPEHLDGQREGKGYAKLFKCPAKGCVKSFPTSRGLEGHLATRHAGEKIEKADSPEIRRSALEMTRDEAVAYIGKVRPHLSKAACERIVDFVLTGGVK